MTNQSQDTQEHEYDDIESSIERCPHDKENPYAQISRSLIRDNSVSPECRMVLIYLLSMKDGWVINPSQIAKAFAGHLGKNKIYILINEAIEKGYMKRIYDKNKESKNLKGKSKYYLSESAKFKKCFRHPDFREHETRDPENEDYKNNNHTSSEEEVLNKESSSIRKDVDDLIFSDSEREDLNNYSEQEISEAIRITKECCTQTKNSSMVKFFFTTIKNLKQSPKKVKIPPAEELKKHFKHGEFYNQAECYFTQTHIGFGRSMRHESIDLKYFKWENFQKLCDAFGIQFKR